MVYHDYSPLTGFVLTLPSLRSEVVQISIVEWIFVVPLHLDGNSVLKAVHGVCWRIVDVCIDGYFGVEILRMPASNIERLIDGAYWLWETKGQRPARQREGYSIWAIA